jgi:Zn-dependent M28 family amino/carboxypeptidase
LTRLRTLTVGVAGALALSLASPAPVSAVDQIGTDRFTKSVTVGGILAHERVFQRIANNNDGTRASGTRGYDRSARYVMKRLEKAGYRVRQQEFTFPFFAAFSPAVLQQVTPEPTDYETDTFEYSGSGEVVGTLVPIDVQVPPPAEPGSTSGCEAADFPAAPAEPAVALIQRGTCDFAVKAANAQAAGYDAAVVFNEGQEGRTEVLTNVTLGTPVDIPVVGMSFADGAALTELAGTEEVTMRVVTDTETDLDATTSNVIADSRKGNKGRVVVVGAHLDSVVDGAGINDNGSGVSTILEIAEELAETKGKLRQRVRFAFWGAEESGLLGSEHYVASLSDRALGRIVANLNFDMLGSPNYVRFVYDGDGSEPDGIVGPPGSAQIERLFTRYFQRQGLQTDGRVFDGRSDYGPFIAAGIPAGGLFSGAEGIKTPEQAEVYGGEAGVAFDPCYHQGCDDMTNLSTRALRELGDAAAHAVLTLARSRSGFFEDGSFRKAPQRARSFDFSGSHAVR